MPESTNDPKLHVHDGTLFWVLYWSASAIDNDPGQIIQYYRALRDLFPACSEYDRQALRHALRGKLNSVSLNYPNDHIIRHHIDLIWGIVGKE